MTQKLLCGDCLMIMPLMAAQSIDMVLVDLPYGTTSNPWDEPLSLTDLWTQLLRVTKENAALVFTASQPFTTDLIMSQRDLFRYELIWNKTKSGNFALAKKQPMKAHENILVFYRKQPTYNPQMTERGSVRKKGGGKASTNFKDLIPTVSYNNLYYPLSIIKASTGSRLDHYHPTQKPIELLEFLINSYSNENETILDCCMGVGSTGLAAQQLNRNFIGIEKDQEFFDVASWRLNKS